LNIYICSGLQSISPVHKAFQNQDQDQTQVKNSFTMDFL